MCTLYPLGSVSHNPDALWLSYESDGFNNREWRPCVERFLREVEKRGHTVSSVHVPPFAEAEDFVPLEYLIDGTSTTFMSDHLLSLITIESNNRRILQDIWASIGNQLGVKDR